MRKAFTLLVAFVAALTFSAVPAAAVTDGELDGNGHPYVGLMVAQDKKGNPLWRCSGTLISAKVFLTAGHCTEAPAAKAQIWFAADVESGIPGNGYPFKGDVGGKTYTHPDYNPNVFYIRDLGAVVLDRAITMSKYGAVPRLNQLDARTPVAPASETPADRTSWAARMSSAPSPRSPQRQLRRHRRCVPRGPELEPRLDRHPRQLSLLGMIGRTAREGGPLLSLSQRNDAFRLTETDLPRWAPSGRACGMALAKPRGMRLVPEQRARPVLIVDDDAETLAAERALLLDDGFRVIEARDGAEALRAVQQDPPAVVVLDVQMPGMDGPTFARELRMALRRVPLVILTGVPDPRREADRCNAEAYLSKPFDAGELVRIVRRFAA